METAELKRTFGRRVRALREQQGLSQEELAERINRSLDTVGNIERGANGTRLEVAATLAEVLGVSLSELVEVETGPRVERQRRRQVAKLAQRLEVQDQPTFDLLNSVLEAALKLAQNQR